MNDADNASPDRDVPGAAPTPQPEFELAPGPQPAPELQASADRPNLPGEGAFARKVAGVFTTQITLFAILFVNSILLSRIFGPDNQGIYAAIVTLPTMLASFGTLGLPSAVNYFAGKGVSLRSLTRAAYILTAMVSAVLLVAVWIVLPVLEQSILKAGVTVDPVTRQSSDDLIRAILVVVPLGLLASFGGSILYGRQAVRVYNLIQILTAALLLAWTAIVVGLGHGGVSGAVTGSILMSGLTVVLVMIAVHRLARSDSAGESVSYRGLASYGARSYPASLSGYFSYRADNFIIQAVYADPKRPLGLYTRAVSIDELVFYVPNSVATLFLPRVAGATAEESARMVARVGRLTTLLTVAVVLALMPVAYVGIHLVLPHFVDCLPAFYALLPGMVTLSVGKVMTSYISGRGRPGLVAFGTTVSLFVNIALNLYMIPAYGIVGASLSSVVSYTLQAAVAVYFARRLSGNSVLSLFVPGREEIRVVRATLPRLLRGIPGLRRLLPASQGGR